MCMIEKKENDELKEALLDLLDMLGALSGNHHELHGWGLHDHRQIEIWELGQRILQQRHGSDL